MHSDPYKNDVELSTLGIIQNTLPPLSCQRLDLNYE